MNLDINKITEVLKTFEEIEFAYLYGSYANGTATPLSDVDIAVFQKHKNTFELKMNEFKIEAELMKEIPGIEFDVRSLNNAPITVTGKIINEGKFLFCRDEQRFLDYTVSKRMQYMDYMIVYKPIFDKRYEEMLND
ncbi:MAG: nucleotidyltransferase domain-containing protein [Ignavibacteria bacterium]|nr:nucleotidyltransferase domain-containing protein [Ignavibacteria bacterium]